MIFFFLEKSDWTEKEAEKAIHRLSFGSRKLKRLFV